MNRRDTLGAMLALFAAPAICKAEILMPIKPTLIVGYGVPPPLKRIKAYYFPKHLPNSEVLEFMGTYYEQPHRINTIPVFRNGERDYDTPCLLQGFASDWIEDKGVFICHPRDIIKWELA
jgi:hypothetical protein